MKRFSCGCFRHNGHYVAVCAEALLLRRASEIDQRRAIALGNEGDWRGRDEALAAYKDHFAMAVE